MAAQRFYGSICLTDLIAAVKAQHSSARKAESNQKIYVNCTMWANEEPDDKGNSVAIHLASAKDAPETETKAKKIYIGNFKKAPPAGEVAPSAKDIETAVEGLDDLPF